MGWSRDMEEERILTSNPNSTPTVFVKQLPNSIRHLHKFVADGLADSVNTRAGQIEGVVAKVSVFESDRERWPVLKDAESVWIVYGKEG